MPTTAFLSLTSLSYFDDEQQVRPIVSAAGNGPRDFGANVDVRAEGVIHKFPGGGKIIASAEASKSFGRAGGHGWNGPPQGQVGIRAELPIGRK
ncbi:hypothetical protein HPB52_004092 [Rhipicephalus sanguineus]|uniref:Uncharacterized protein n=1 Tax=Rhipicephalus sanguineus TaxID=34632 RepID=A0A9D4QG67_RHISA|nr:hypothetical protein HPB52_004092 [Rhipicephalus sanguineus]